MKDTNSPWRDVRKWLPGAIISIVAIFFILQLANWKDMSLTFASIQPLNLILAVIINLIALAFRAQAWRVLLEYKPGIVNSYLLINLGYFLNNLFPLRAGEIGRSIFMGRAIKVSPFHVLSTVVIERAFDLAIAAGLLLATLPMAFGFAWAKPVAIITLLVVIIALVLLYLVARNNQQVQRWMEKLAGRWGFVKKYIIPRLGSFFDGLSVLTNPFQFFLSVFWIILTWVFWLVIYYIMLLMIAPHAPVWWAIFITGIIALGLAIPSAPAGLGVYEAAVVAAISILDPGITASVSLAFAIIVHILQFCITGIFGIICLVREGLSLGSVFTEIKNRGTTQ